MGNLKPTLVGILSQERKGDLLHFAVFGSEPHIKFIEEHVKMLDKKSQHGHCCSGPVHDEHPLLHPLVLLVQLSKR